MTATVSRAGRGLRSLCASVPDLERSIDRDQLQAAVARGHFSPGEEQHLAAWFARFLTVRSGLWEVIGEVSEPFSGDLGRIESVEDWRCFVLGYAAACTLVRMDRGLVQELATDKLVQRKLNEGDRERRIPRKQFTAIFDSLTRPRSALYLYEAMRLAERERRRLLALADDADVGEWVRELESLEASLDASKRRYLRLLAAYGKHALRRRGASTKQRIALSALEVGGRLASEVRLANKPKRVDGALLARLRALLQPGDVLVTRHEGAFTNLLLPGYWPHAALYVGTTGDRERMGVAVDGERRARWAGERCVLEALKDGVRFRFLEETLAVDACAILRPRLSAEEIAFGLARAVQHEGKLYNFDFDFFRSDRLVCTGVIYRAYDGLGELHFELRERGGRLTLSAEDVLDMAIDGGQFETIGVFGTGPHPARLVVGAEARAALAASYR